MSKNKEFRITLITYLGIIIGALNTMLIFPRVLGAEKHGLVMLLLSIATVFTQFIHLGVPNILIRFYPYFSEKKSLFTVWLFSYLLWL
ncbi:MAG: hypothetical protein CM15mP23_21160 [Cryomorphaceae bacterium]|nr:MAG: hypothetical protein CM15mP23_21160 [Cryomorphaceae bacterium]